MPEPTHGINAYTDAQGRPQTSVTGPRGHILVTRSHDLDTYQVWHSDSLDTLLTTSDNALAIARACRAAGIPN